MNAVDTYIGALPAVTCSVGSLAAMDVHLPGPLAPVTFNMWALEDMTVWITDDGAVWSGVS